MYLEEAAFVTSECTCDSSFLLDTVSASDATECQSYCDCQAQCGYVSASEDPDATTYVQPLLRLLPCEALAEAYKVYQKAGADAAPDRRLDADAESGSVPGRLHRMPFGRCSWCSSCLAGEVRGGRREVIPPRPPPPPEGPTLRVSLVARGLSSF